MRVLELGSATGFLLEALAGDVASVAGVEPGSDCRAYANERGIRTVKGLIEVENERFDLVLAYYVVEHLRDPIGSLGRLYELLDEGGLLAVEVPNVEDALVSFYRVDAFNRFLLAEGALLQLLAPDARDLPAASSEPAAGEGLRGARSPRGARVGRHRDPCAARRRDRGQHAEGR
jgi:SAM-dependent methyltransferase